MRLRVSAGVWLLATAALLAQDNDGGPPKLKRGRPDATRQTTKTSEATNPGVSNDPPRPSESQAEQNPTAGDQRQTESNRPAPPSGDPFIDRAREASSGYLESLPNFVCQEFVTRYQSSTRPVSWQVVDNVTMDLVYEDGKESYRNVKINGKATGKSIEESGGVWATGDFGTLQANVMDPAVEADFHGASSDRINGKDAVRYDFSVDQDRSRWTVIADTSKLTAAHTGSVWFEKSTARVLRIEIQAEHIPNSFGFNAVEWSLDYGYSHIGDNDFLVPTHAETLYCQRGTRNCARNVTEFRNYKRYGGEATITFEK